MSHQVVITIDGVPGLPLVCPAGTIIEITHPDGKRAYVEITGDPLDTPTLGLPGPDLHELPD